jgi:ParB family chromosome partitioning protein
MPQLDIGGLEEFDPAALATDAAGSPLELPLDAIEFDPKQPRRQVREETLTELAETIRAEGVLQPICVRPHAERKGRYIINHGERRVRAARMAGLITIPGFIRLDLDPYTQVIENIQRDDLLPMELAAFVIEREQAGDSRAEIARRLGKPASLITEMAELAQAAAPIRKAYDDGRCRDVRALYLLVRTHREQPEAVEELLAGDGPIKREEIEALAAEQRVVRRKPRVPNGGPDHHKGAEGGSSYELLVEINGQDATFDLGKRPSKTTAEVCFADGSRRVVELVRLRLVAWRETQ